MSTEKANIRVPLTLKNFASIKAKMDAEFNKFKEHEQRVMKLQMAKYEKLKEDVLLDALSKYLKREIVLEDAKRVTLIYSPNFVGQIVFWDNQELGVFKYGYRKQTFHHPFDFQAPIFFAEFVPNDHYKEAFNLP